MSKIELAGIDSDKPFDATVLGAMLREMREHMQRDLKDVALELRIRRPYLEAIEDGRLDDLPGPAYTTGFLRSYSIYLGLDSEDIVNQFKQAGIDIDRRTSLTLPSPLEEGRLPSGSILMVSALLAVVVYAGWYFLSTDDRSALDLIASAPPGPVMSPTVPTVVKLTTDAPASASASDDVVSVVGGAQPPAAVTVVAPTPTSAPVETPVQTAATIDAPPMQLTPADQAAPPEIPVAGPAPPAEAVAIARGAAMDMVATAAPPALPPPAKRPASPPPAQQAAATDDRIVRQDLPERIVDTQNAIPPQRIVGTRPPAQIATAVGDAGTMIKIVAIADSWIEIREADGKSLFSRLMRQGETHEVASRPGLTLLTGNAGGVQLQIDGKTIPPLGPAGKIMQNVAIDADSLRARAPTTP